jgi:hypothetical protein
MEIVQFTLPQALADQARKAGLLAPEKLTEMIQAELRQEAGDRFLQAMERLHAVKGEPMTPEQVEAEIRAVRKEATQSR